MIIFVNGKRELCNMSFGIDKDLKEQADDKTSMKKLEPSERLKKALKELEEIENGKIKLKRYYNMTDLIAALNND